MKPLNHFYSTVGAGRRLIPAVMYAAVVFTAVAIITSTTSSSAGYDNGHDQPKIPPERVTISVTTTFDVDSWDMIFDTEKIEATSSSERRAEFELQWYPGLKSMCLIDIMPLDFMDASDGAARIYLSFRDQNVEKVVWFDGGTSIELNLKECFDE